MDNLVEIIYKGETVLTVPAGKTVALHTEKKKFTEDLLIKANVPETGGGTSGSNAELNIAYGETEPTDTSKLWIKTSKPEAVRVVSKIEGGSEKLNIVVENLPTAACGIASAAIGTKVYLFGGSDGGNLNTINVFDVELALAANNMLIEASTTKNIFNLLPTVELGVNSVYLGNADGVAEKATAALYVDGAWVDI